MLSVSAYRLVGRRRFDGVDHANLIRTGPRFQLQTESLLKAVKIEAASDSGVGVIVNPTCHS